MKVPYRVKQVSSHSARICGNSDLSACFNMLIIHHVLSQQMWVQKILRREPFNWTNELFKKQRNGVQILSGKKKAK